MHLPDHLLLKVFTDIEAVAHGGLDEDTDGIPFENVRDDSLQGLIDGFQKRLGLPLVCKRWNLCLAQPCYVWAYLNIGFHELWNVQQVFLQMIYI